ncbi:redoxin domain-containing protein [Altererythrobacter soli]|uniref:peptidylprolyl isomerase n=1 Tax=Croceibacterium soli TaxID=1739690 RepID=A0A6I4UTS6_9SPHN|nr:redoxin domain-containing protein [Croceibacterium soli]MXP41139.1 redoxin domain-containing protein [Croceibacterium soli]
MRYIATAVIFGTLAMSSPAQAENVAHQQAHFHGRAFHPVASLPAGIELTITKLGNGHLPRKGEHLAFRILGKLPDGTVIDDNSWWVDPPTVEVGGPHVLVKGLHLAMEAVPVGTRATVKLSPEMAFGSEDVPSFGVKGGSIVFYQFETVSSHKSRPSDELKRAIRLRGLEGVRAAVRTMMNGRGTDVYLGYEGLKYAADILMYRLGETAAATELAKLNATRHRKRAKAQWAYAEAMLLAGRPSEALAHLRTTKSLTPDASEFPAALRAASSLEGFSEMARMRLLLKRAAMFREHDVLEFPINLEAFSAALTRLIDKDTPTGPMPEDILDLYAFAVDSEASRAKLALSEALDSQSTPLWRSAELNRELVRRAKQLASSQRSALSRPLNFGLRGLAGQRIESSNFRGRPLLIFFFTATGPASRAAIRHIRPEYDDLKCSGFEVLGVSMDQSSSSDSVSRMQTIDLKGIKDFVAREKIPWPISYDGTGNIPIAEQFLVTDNPRLFLIDASGHFVGELLWDEVKSSVIRLLGKSRIDQMCKSKLSATGTGI